MFHYKVALTVGQLLSHRPKIFTLTVYIKGLMDH